MASLGDAETVAVLAAMVQELRPTVRALGLEAAQIGEHETREGLAEGRHVVGTVTAMGPRAATAITELVLDHRPIDHLLVIGICGGIDQSLDIGALVVPSEAVVESTGRASRPSALDPHQPTGRLLTTDQLHTDPETVAALFSEGFVAVDMETAAIGAVCEDRGVPWSVFRAVSDRAGDPFVDPELLSMSAADGQPAPGAVARYLLRHPGRIPKLNDLRRGMNKAVAASTEALCNALAA